MNQDILTQTIGELNRPDISYYIWGAYWQGAEVYEDYVGKINLVGFIDTNSGREGDIFSHLPIFYPSFLAEKDPATTKIIMAYHSHATLHELLESYGFIKNQGWFPLKEFSVLLSYGKEHKIILPHLFFSLFQEKTPLPVSELFADFDLCFQKIDHIQYFGITDENWSDYAYLQEFLLEFQERGYRNKVDLFFFYGDVSTTIPKECLSLFADLGITMRLSNYKEVGCDTAPLFPLMEALKSHSIPYYLIFPTGECTKYENLRREYDYLDTVCRDAKTQYFLSTCDGDLRLVLREKTFYWKKSLDLSTYFDPLDWNSLEQFSLREMKNKEELLSFLTKEPHRPVRNLKLCMINCGLGNQIFQYIFKRYLEENTGDTVILEDSFYFTKTEHNGSELRQIFPKAKLNFLSDYYKPYILKQMALIEKKFNLFFHVLLQQAESPYIIAEEMAPFLARLNDVTDKGEISGKFAYSPHLAQVNAPFTYYYGHWICEQWFTHEKMKNLLLEELTFSPITDEMNLASLKSIKKCESVAVHIRRGDTMTLPSHPHIWHSSYYVEAIHLYREAFPKEIIPTFFLFSDDIPWCQEERALLGFLPEDKLVFVAENEKENSFRDLQLMSLCQHMIISNSSFSFMAALLNQNQSYIKPFAVFDQLKDTFEIEPLPNGSGILSFQKIRGN